ncbi:MAG: hypothetical protein HXX14_16885 [Bacteroidetes bacterium]|nr:hypothetical protein [Bacteroidota bacterium]
MQKYLNKISGALFNRIDLPVEVVLVPFSELTNNKNGEQSKEIRNRVITTRHIQEERFKAFSGTLCNA